jgi:hypothetical protein
LAAGTHSLTAIYSPLGGFGGSTSAAVPVNVTAAATSSTATTTNPAALRPVSGADLEFDPVHTGAYDLVIGPPTGRVVIRLANHGRQSIQVSIRSLKGNYLLRNTFAANNLTEVVVFGQRSNDKVQFMGRRKLPVVFM